MTYIGLGCGLCNHHKKDCLLITRLPTTQPLLSVLNCLTKAGPFQRTLVLLCLPTDHSGYDAATLCIPAFGKQAGKKIISCPPANAFSAWGRMGIKAWEPSDLQYCPGVAPRVSDWALELASASDFCPTPLQAHSVQIPKLLVWLQLWSEGLVSNHVERQVSRHRTPGKSLFSPLFVVFS